METLPVEMIERIAKQLTPQDLARCSAVCREWYDIFNKDWMWKPHCDPELEEPLRTIPCVAIPAFVASEAENSTLSSICHWKLAFMKEKHLWKNWKRQEIMDKTMEKIIECDFEYFRGVKFVTDTLIVVWYSDKIEILDASVLPATLMAKTDTSVNIERYAECSVSGTTRLLVSTNYSIDVFNVDIINKSIKLKHNINFDCWDAIRDPIENLYLHLNIEASKLTIFDLDTGKILKEEPIPVKNTQNEIANSVSIDTSPTCDFAAFTFEVYVNDGNAYGKYYIYSPKELAFLPGPVADRPEPLYSSVCLHGRCLALWDGKSLTVINFQTREVLLNYEVNIGYGRLSVCYNRFVLWSHYERQSWVKYYCPLNRTLATLYESSDQEIFEVTNNKFIAIYDREQEVLESVLKPVGQKVQKYDIYVRDGSIINRSFTRVLFRKYLHGKLSCYVGYLW